MHSGRWTPDRHWRSGVFVVSGTPRRPKGSAHERAATGLSRGDAREEQEALRPRLAPACTFWGASPPKTPDWGHGSGGPPDPEARLFRHRHLPALLREHAGLLVLLQLVLDLARADVEDAGGLRGAAADGLERAQDGLALEIGQRAARDADAEAGDAGLRPRGLGAARLAQRGEVRRVERRL